MQFAMTNLNHFQLNFYGKVHKLIGINSVSKLEEDTGTSAAKSCKKIIPYKFGNVELYTNIYIMQRRKHC